MVQTVLYDGSYNGFLCAVFDVYFYKFTDVDICTEARFNGNVFDRIHHVHNDVVHSDRVRMGLAKKLSKEAQTQVYWTFLSELSGIENVLLQYIQYALASPVFMEADFSHPAVLTVTQTAKRVWREKHRMEAFVRFQKTSDGLYYAIIDPDFNVLPLIADHFEKRYADQCWLIYDTRRRYGLYYDLNAVTEVQMEFNAETNNGGDVHAVYGEGEEMYQRLWQQYFKSINIAARKNTKLHIKHMPRRYWKYLLEKKPLPHT